MEDSDFSIENHILSMIVYVKNYNLDDKIEITENVIRDILECFRIILIERTREPGELIYDFEFNIMVEKVTEYIKNEAPYHLGKTTISSKFIKDVLDIVFSFNMYQHFNENIKIVPVSMEDYYRKGTALFHFRYLADAIEYLTKAINYDIGKVDETIISNSYFLRATCFWKTGEMENAYRDVNIACYLEPENLDYLFLKINVEIDLRKKAVINSIRKAVSILRRMKKVLEKRKTGIYKVYNVAEFNVTIGTRKDSIIISPTYIEDKVSELKRLFAIRHLARRPP